MLVSLAMLAVVVLLVLGVPFWVCLGLGTSLLLYSTGVMPLTLIGEALFDGVNSFALIAIPLFVLTGDVMVRSGLAYRLLDFAEASFGSFRSGFGTATVWDAGCSPVSPAPMRPTRPRSGGSRWIACKRKDTRRTMRAPLWLLARARAS